MGSKYSFILLHINASLTSENVESLMFFLFTGFCELKGCKLPTDPFLYIHIYPSLDPWEFFRLLYPHPLDTTCVKLCLYVIYIKTNFKIVTSWTWVSVIEEVGISTNTVSKVLNGCVMSVCEVPTRRGGRWKNVKYDICRYRKMDLERHRTQFQHWFGRGFHTLRHLGGEGVKFKSLVRTIRIFFRLRDRRI